MSTYTLTKTRLFEGVWDGVLTSKSSDGIAPTIEVTLLEKLLDHVTLIENGDNRWILRIPIPSTAIADGVHTFLIREKSSGETLESFSIIAGEAVAEDIRAEMDLLRAELDMLKRAFRRHCVETT
ncbi:hypothetical protein [Cognatishimia sp.]|uniref:hypothetical protein n=1 Tax=Cognatishimia sp. TaxID=2211648 RepID=UPI0035192B78